MNSEAKHFNRTRKKKQTKNPVWHLKFEGNTVNSHEKLNLIEQIHGEIKFPVKEKIYK